VDISHFSGGWQCMVNQTNSCEHLFAMLRRYRRLLERLRCRHDSNPLHSADSDQLVEWLRQEIEAGNTPWVEWVRVAPYLERLLNLLKAADGCRHPQAHFDLNSPTLLSLLDPHTLSPLIGLLVEEGIPAEVAYHIAARLVCVRYLYGDNRFGFYTEMLNIIYLSGSGRNFPPEEFLGALLGIVHSPVPSPYEPFYFTLAQLYFFVACIGLVLLFFALFLRRVLIPRLRRRFSSFK
jgi:hypothetical protein